MPRTSSNSVRHDAVPLDEVLRAARAWSARLKKHHPHIVRIGCFGSYARGDYVPGSDLDVLLEVSETRMGRQADRAAEFLPERFPVGMELFVYSSAELARLRSERSSFIAAIDREFVQL